MQSKTFKRNGHLLEKKFKEYLIPTTLSGMSMMIACIVDGIIVGQTMGTDARLLSMWQSPLLYSCKLCSCFLLQAGPPWFLLPKESAIKIKQDL